MFSNLNERWNDKKILRAKLISRLDFFKIFTEAMIANGQNTV